MGYASIFWVREHAIRASLAQTGKSDSVLKEIGRRVLALEPRSAWDMGGGPLLFFDTPSVFFPYRSFHSTDSSLIFWTGNRLCPVPDAEEGDMFRVAHRIAVEIVGTQHVVLPISQNQYKRYVGGVEPWHNRLEMPMYASVYWIYEDFRRDFKETPESNWPCAEVGAAVLDLMLSDWSRSSSPIRNHGGPISRACSFAEPEFAALVWGGNCLRLISEFGLTQA